MNQDRRLSCGDQARLNETGIQQAKAAAEFLEDVPYDFVLSSPYSRARGTAEIANRDRAPILTDDRLVERDAGVLDGRRFEEIDLSGFFNYYKNIEYEGAENLQDFCKRVWGFLDEIKETRRDKSILLVTHNIVIRAIKAYILGIPEDGDIGTYGIKNGDIEAYTLE